MTSKFYDQIIREVLQKKITDPVQLSLAYVVTSLRPVQYRFELDSIRSQYFNKLLQMEHETGPTPKLAWLVGRLYYCNHINKSNSMLDIFLYSQFNDRILKPIFEKNEYTLWALGYLSLDKIVYDRYIKIAPTYIDAVSNINNKIWGDVLNMQACAENQDKEQLEYCVNRLKNNTGEDTLLEALNILPMHDYRLWAYGVVAESLLKIDQNKNEIEAKNLLQQIQKGSKESMKYSDIAIAESLSARITDKYHL